MSGPFPPLRADPDAMTVHRVEEAAFAPFVPASRRRLLSASLTAAVPAAAAAARSASIDPDAQLIAWCVETTMLGERYEALLDTLFDVPGNDPRYAAGHAVASRRQLQLRDRRRLILTQRASTVAGLQAKAAVVRSLINVESGDPVKLFAWSLARDLGATEQGA